MARSTAKGEATEHAHGSRGILVLPPSTEIEFQSAVEFQAGVEEVPRFGVNLGDADGYVSLHCETADGSLTAGHHVVTQMTERQTPTLRKHFLPYLERYVETAEQRGQDRNLVVAQLLRLLDNQARRIESCLRARPVTHSGKA